MKNFLPLKIFTLLLYLSLSSSAHLLGAMETPPSLNNNESCVITPAPDFTWQEKGKLTHLSSLLGKPVLLLIAPSPKSWFFRCQLNDLKSIYSRLANSELICAAAFYEEDGLIPSNIPFITVNNGAAIAAAYGIHEGFAVAVISSDRNLDCLSTKTLPGQRIADLIDASYPTQAKLRRH